MKKLIAVALSAAVLGGIVVLAGAKIFGFNSNSGAGLFPNDFNGRVQFAGLNDAAPNPANLNFTTAAAKTLPVVVNIQSAERVREQGGGGFDMSEIPAPFRQFFGPGQRSGRDEDNIRMGTGSGVLISPDGYIVTNNHVVAGADKLTVTLNDKRTFTAKVIGTDPSTDLSLVKIEAEGLPFINFSSSDAVQVGEWVLAVGNPFNLTSSVTAGIVSAKGRDIHILQDQAPIESFIQTDAAINPGNSGGALVNLNGDLIGINTAIASPTGTYAGYGFAIPSNIVAKVVDDLKKYGVAQRGYLGVVIREINGDFAREHDLGNLTQGAYVDSLAENSAGAEAGIKKGDVIVKIDGQPIVSSPDLLEAVGRHRPGDKIAVDVWRKGVQKEFTVTLKNKSGNTEVVKKSDASGLTTVLGADFQTVGKQEAKKLDIAGGVKVEHLGNGKISNQTDMQEGFIITKVDGKPVMTAEELNAALADKQGGVMLEGVYPNRPGTYYYAFGM